MVDNTKFRVFAEESDNVYSDNDYANSNSDSSSSRTHGNKPGTPVDSRLQNTALKTATLISKALLDAIVTNENLGLTSSITELKEAILNGLKNIKVNNADKLDGLDSNSFARLNGNNNFTSRPTYNGNNLLTYDDKISHAVSADSANTATKLADAPIVRDGYEDNKIRIVVGGKSSNEYIVPYSVRAWKSRDGVDIDNKFTTIDKKLSELGFKEGTFTVSVTHKGADITSLALPYVTQKLYKKGKIVVALFKFNATKQQLNNIGSGEFKVDLIIPNEFTPKQFETFYIRRRDTGSGSSVYFSYDVTQTELNKITYSYNISNNAGRIDIEIINQAWEIA